MAVQPGMPAAGGQCLLIMTTCGNRVAAHRLAETLVAARQAACVSILPGVESVYRWDGDIERSGEVILMIKSTAERFDAVADSIRNASDYELPEVLAVPISTGSDDYLDWLRSAVTENE